MMRNTALLSVPEYLPGVLGLTLEELLYPIRPEQPAGDDLRGKSIYRTLQEARREDDPTLPLGPWERELKRADWEQVAALAADTVAHKSKDLQLVAWLAEAQVRRAGFLGLASALTLMQALCEHYWESAFPQIEDDSEHRLNIFRWLNEKLLPALRLVPLTASGRDKGEYCWADWEQARRNEQLIASQGAHAEEEIEGATTQAFTAALHSSPTTFFVSTTQALEEAKRAVAGLEEALEALSGDDAPSLKVLADLLTDIGLLVTGELRRRGVFEKNIETSPEVKEPEASVASVVNAPAEERAALYASNPVRDRNEAYTRLNQIADYLMQIEPHSPVPYVIKRAIEWGQLNTAELYELLFIRHQGQLSIFDMLGIEPRSE